MLSLTIPGGEVYNEGTCKFEKIEPCTLKLEHSLLSLYKWEAKHHVHFLDNKNLTEDDVFDYIKCMTINPVDDKVYNYLTQENIKAIKDYIEDPMTATTFYDPFAKKEGEAPKKEIITAEIIYSSMIILNIPIDIFEKRHLNHLLTLIKVCREKQDPDTDKKNKVNSADMMRHYSELNKSRIAKAKADANKGIK